MGTLPGAFVARPPFLHTTVDTNYHIGNSRFRYWIEQYKDHYQYASREGRHAVAKEAVLGWRAQGGRFLTRTDPSLGDESTCWGCHSLEKAVKVLGEGLTKRKKPEDEATQSPASQKRPISAIGTLGRPPVFQGSGSLSTGRLEQDARSTTTRHQEQAAMSTTMPVSPHVAAGGAVHAGGAPLQHGGGDTSQNQVGGQVSSYFDASTTSSAASSLSRFETTAQIVRSDTSLQTRGHFTGSLCAMDPQRTTAPMNSETT
jgi:hypothetical protein